MPEGRKVYTDFLLVRKPAAKVRFKQSGASMGHDGSVAHLREVKLTFCVGQSEPNLEVFHPVPTTKRVAGGKRDTPYKVFIRSWLKYWVATYVFTTTITTIDACPD